LIDDSDPVNQSVTDRLAQVIGTEQELAEQICLLHLAPFGRQPNLAVPRSHAGERQALQQVGQRGTAAVYLDVSVGDDVLRDQSALSGILVHAASGQDAPVCRPPTTRSPGSPTDNTVFA